MLQDTYETRRHWWDNKSGGIVRTKRWWWRAKKPKPPGDQKMRCPACGQMYVAVAPNRRVPRSHQCACGHVFYLEAE